MLALRPLAPLRYIVPPIVRVVQNPLWRPATCPGSARASARNQFMLFRERPLYSRQTGVGCWRSAPIRYIL